MKIQQFAEQLQQESHASPLMETLQAVRRFNLNTLRDAIAQGEVAGWIEWPPVGQNRAESGV